MKIDLHCHSDFSDGYYSTAELAEKIAKSGVDYVALTDHNTLEGQTSFHNELSRYGISTLSGVELQANYRETEIHILVYGFKLNNEILKECFNNVLDVHNVIDLIHLSGGIAVLAHPFQYGWNDKEVKSSIRSLAKKGLDGIEAYYKSYTIEQQNKLVNLADKFSIIVTGGSDFHGPFSDEEIIGVEISNEKWKQFRNAINNILKSNFTFNKKQIISINNSLNSVSKNKFSLLHPKLDVNTSRYNNSQSNPNTDTSSYNNSQSNPNTDTSSYNNSQSNPNTDTSSYNNSQSNPNTDTPRYNNSQSNPNTDTSSYNNLQSNPNTDTSSYNNSQSNPNTDTPRYNNSNTKFNSPNSTTSKPIIIINWKWMFSHILFPALMVIFFFIYLIFFVLIPNFETLLLERKKEMTIELTNSAVSILQDYYRLYREGALSKEEAQKNAIERIRKLRYGPDSKDYFWITDKHPKMIMHPYRKDLEGTDLSDFKDPDGAKPFVQFVSKVKYHSSGFVRYIWQWQDDPDRMASKESYVRSFEPWDWIIGTGLYVEDVENQISNLTSNMIDVSFIVIVISSFLIFIVASQSLKLEKMRSRAEQELRYSHEHYESLVESSSTGILLLENEKFAFANSTFLELSGYTQNELSFLDIHDIFTIKNEKNSSYILNEISKGYNTVEPIEANLKKNDGDLILVLLSSNHVYFSGREGVLLSIQDITKHSAKKTEIERDKLISRLQSSMLYLTEPVSESMSQPVICFFDSTVKQAIKIMNNKNSGAIIVSGPNNELLGIVTDYDIRKRVIGENINLNEPVSKIMSAPVVAINENTPVFEAVLIEREKNVDYLAVTNDSNTLSGLIESGQLLKPDMYSPVILTHKIRNAKSTDDLTEIYNRLPVVITSLINSGALPQNISQVISTVSDEVYKKIIEIIIDEIGQPPVKFVVIVLGSEARKEQTLATDQDNALIYEDLSNEIECNKISEYFLKLGEKLSDLLNFVGYKYCRGNNMLKNKKWNQPIEQWKEYFHSWIIEPVDEALSYCNVFFDQRCVFGDESLLGELKNHIVGLINSTPAFLSYMALNTLNYKPPIGLFGKIITGYSGINDNKVNIKEPILAINNFARLYAIKHNIFETNTVDRLKVLYLNKIISENYFRTIIQSYNNFMQLRYRHQINMIKEEKEPDNLIDLTNLTQIEKVMLKNSLSQISLIQKKVTQDFHVSR